MPLKNVLLEWHVLQLEKAGSQFLFLEDAHCTSHCLLFIILYCLLRRREWPCGTSVQGLKQQAYAAVSS
jgi:hypothetical protein